jgi:adenylate kinase
MYHTFASMNKAIVLLGPTGIGKSPLGKLLERRGLRGRRCFHFDFGANLRAIAASLEGLAAGDRKNDIFSLRERAVILNSLTTGALLEDEDFPIAAKILDRTIGERRVDPEDLLVMNGLPRHAGQARRLEDTISVRAVIALAGTPAVIGKRIRIDAGGDRAGRVDDSLEAIERKLEIFEERTRPLIDFYERREVPIITIAVGAGTTAEEMLARLEHEDIPGL